ncbi:glycosyltransferase [Candidatus Gracilibacteria bacterium]|nr:glycosyltransferase [Candidatus Gracilibacteria bacterium]NJM87612.1 glycosyltransferase [Hydrococcus sp. RU_2_2]NJP18281.1 glycosyltransferase [Hydrococcus sp. CRU_1_1]
MLTICKYLLDTTPELSILLISGSPVLHSFRMPQGLDYIKLPCLGRNEKGELSAKYLKKDPQEITKLRSEIIKTAVANFEPDLILVDKKPYGLQGELTPTLKYLNKYLPETKLVLLLRDILDSPEVTIKDWHQNDSFRAIQRYYDQVLVVGMPEIFDLVQEYQFPYSIAKKTKFCGYLRREYGSKSSQVIRQELQVNPDEQLVLITPGGGGDGYHLVETYLQGLATLPTQHKIKSLIFSGPEMSQDQRDKLARLVEQIPHVQISEFTDDIASYMEAADTVVCMGGYNTVCEILSLNKKAVVIPRVNPVQEQLIRAQKMSAFGLFKTIDPDKLTAKNLIEAILEQLKRDRKDISPIFQLDLDGLPRIKKSICTLLFGKDLDSTLNWIYLKSSNRRLASIK